MKKLAFFTAILLFAIAISAQPVGMMSRGHIGHGDMMGSMIGKPAPMMGVGMEESLLAQVGLKEDQIQKIRAAKMDIEKDIIKLNSELKLKRVSLAEEMMKDNPNENIIKNITTDIGKIRGEITFKKVQGGLVLNKYLTKKQIEKLRELRETNMRKMAERRIERRGIRRNIRR
ncbi:MAG TPA: hypothetical protein ENK92_00265 [Bacteroidetes bacterium]|nr:hypothetical protein [Bacteroidota bacterium]